MADHPTGIHAIRTFPASIAWMEQATRLLAPYRAQILVHTFTLATFSKGTSKFS
ncbi:hypothetical protein [Bacteroides acidifaciens]|uniref:hypothetical protein n=1 Tax=Bacteroides acidifaciens TaxID=85831 RepID=UPI003F68D728